MKQGRSLFLLFFVVDLSPSVIFGAAVRYTSLNYSPFLTQTILQARSSIEIDFQDICDDNSIIDKLHTLDIMCAQQGIVDGASEYVS